MRSERYLFNQDAWFGQAFHIRMVRRSTLGWSIRVLGLVRRSTLEMVDIQARRSLYLQLIRSQLGYASQVWCPQTIESISAIEKVQRRATKYILNLGYMSDIPYPTRLNKLNLLPITYWHEYLDLVMLYKIINGMASVSHGVRLVAVSSRKTRSSSNDDCISLTVPFARTVTFQTSYFIRTTKVWNILNSDLRNKNKSFSSFKYGLVLYYRDALTKSYDTEVPRTWKPVCIKCKRARSLVNSINCCF